MTIDTANIILPWMSLSIQITFYDTGVASNTFNYRKPAQAKVCEIFPIHLKLMAYTKVG